MALLGTEIEQEKLRLVDALLWLGVALICLGVGLVLLCGLVIIWLWESHRLLGLGILAALCLGGGVGLCFAARQRLQSPGGLFSASLSELARDRAGLDRHDSRPDSL